MDPAYYKIPSGEITNLPYLRKVAGFGRDVIMSTGIAAHFQEVKDAFTVLMDAGFKTQDQISIEYPTPMEDVNLKAMIHIKKELGVEIGYSDHTLGIGSTHQLL